MIETERPQTPQSEPAIMNLPNQLTFSRLVLAIILFGLIVAEGWLWALFVFALAAVTDWLDGYFARKHKLSSSLGRVFDPLVDKVLICGAYIFLLGLPYARSGLMPWMVTVVVARELIINGLRSYLESKGVLFGADWLGKIKMVLQCAALTAIFVALYALEAWASADVLILIRNILVWAMLAATALSGLQYLAKACVILKEEARR
ncbi:MAG: CDP-diacylglycerol--glycerol-3-phosphate 3-phosphatidyltransferase [Gemmataceae bacterium]